MLEPAVHIGCSARVIPGAKRCTFRARWWVDTGSEVRAMCGTHARQWQGVGMLWRLYTYDSAVDRAYAKAVWE
jgi:hypothetical protein